MQFEGSPARVGIIGDLNVSGDIGAIASMVDRVFTDGIVLGVQTSIDVTTDNTAWIRVNNNTEEATITLDAGREIGTTHFFSVNPLNNFDVVFQRDGTETINGETTIFRDAGTGDTGGMYIAFKETSTSWRLYGPIPETADSIT
jgi:hypothetical protein